MKFLLKTESIEYVEDALVEAVFILTVGTVLVSSYNCNYKYLYCFLVFGLFFFFPVIADSENCVSKKYYLCIYWWKVDFSTIIFNNPPLFASSEDFFQYIEVIQVYFKADVN